MRGRSVDLDDRDRRPADEPAADRRAETHALLVAHGMAVTEEGKARARRTLVEADERMTPERWRALRSRLGLAA